MADAFVDTITVIPRGLVFVVLGVVVLALARLAQDVVTPYRIGNQLTNRDNVALALSIAGYYLGVIVVFLGALYQPFSLIVDGGLGFTEDYWLTVLEVFLYSLGGIVALNLARIVVDKLVLHRFSTEKEIIEDRNAGTGAVGVRRVRCRRAGHRRLHLRRGRRPAHLARLLRSRNGRADTVRLLLPDTHVHGRPRRRSSATTPLSE